MVATLSGVTYLIVVEPILSKSFQAAGFTLAILSATFLLGMKCLALFIHGPIWKSVEIQLRSMVQPFIWIPDYWTTGLSETWFNAWVARRQAAAIGFICCGWVSFPILGCLLFDTHPLSYRGQRMALVPSPPVNALQPPLAMF